MFKNIIVLVAIATHSYGLPIDSHSISYISNLGSHEELVNGDLVLDDHFAHLPTATITKQVFTTLGLGAYKSTDDQEVGDQEAGLELNNHAVHLPTPIITTQEIPTYVHKITPVYKKIPIVVQFHHEDDQEETHQVEEEHEVEEKHEKPAHYEFQYGVADKHTGDFKSQKESRYGDVVKGEYSLKEADGTTRIVKYTADKKSGFNAVVIKKGHAVHPIIESKKEVKKIAVPLVLSHSYEAEDFYH